MDHKKINELMLEHGDQWIQWKSNRPTARSMGGEWKRQIRSTCSILIAILKTHGTSLNDESLQTLLVKVEAIVNTRPNTSKSLSDVHNPVPLCPMYLLTMKSRLALPLPREFQKEDIYYKTQWACVQKLSK